MSTHCCYRTIETPTCHTPATHRVTRQRDEAVWRAEEGALDRAVGGRRLVQVPEFCAAHADAVCAQRNAPVVARQGARHA